MQAAVGTPLIHIPAHRRQSPRLAPRYRDLLKAPLDDALGGAVRMAARLFSGSAEAGR